MTTAQLLTQWPLAELAQCIQQSQVFINRVLDLTQYVERGVFLDGYPSLSVATVMLRNA
jgi:hypothetical protein